MTELAKRLSSSHDLAAKAARVLQTRAKLAQERVNFVERERQGLPPVLHFNYEMMLDGRTRQRAVNYALVRIRTVLGSTGSRRPRVVAAN